MVDKTRQTTEEVQKQQHGHAWSQASSRGMWRTLETGETWLQSRLSAPHDQRIDDDDDDGDDGDDN